VYIKLYGARLIIYIKSPINSPDIQIKRTPEAGTMNKRNGLVWYAALMGAMMLAPGFFVPAEDARVEDIIFHINTFSDGKTEKRLSFMNAGLVGSQDHV
jgi:hypothetical protein